MIVGAVTHDLAGGYSTTYSRMTQDFRRLLFRKQVELLTKLFQNWGERKMEEHKKILEQHPFQDK